MIYCRYLQKKERIKMARAKVYNDQKTHLTHSESIYWTRCGLGSQTVTLIETVPPSKPCTDCFEGTPQTIDPNPSCCVTLVSKRWHVCNPTNPKLTLCNQDATVLEFRDAYEIDSFAHPNQNLCKTCFNRIPTTTKKEWFPNA